MSKKTSAFVGLLLAAALTLPLSGVLTYGKPHALTFTDVCAMAASRQRRGEYRRDAALRRHEALRQ